MKEPKTGLEAQLALLYNSLDRYEEKLSDVILGAILLLRQENAPPEQIAWFNRELTGYSNHSMNAKLQCAPDWRVIDIEWMEELPDEKRILADHKKPLSEAALTMGIEEMETTLADMLGDDFAKRGPEHIDQCKLRLIRQPRMIVLSCSDVFKYKPFITSVKLFEIYLEVIKQIKPMVKPITPNPDLE